MLSLFGLRDESLRAARILARDGCEDEAKEKEYVC